MLHHIEVPVGRRVTSVTFNGQPLTLRAHPPTISLVPVTDRGVLYQPPTTHFGKPLADLSPLTIARLTIEYLEELIAQAGRFVSPQTTPNDTPNSLGS